MLACKWSGKEDKRRENRKETNNMTKTSYSSNRPFIITDTAEKESKDIFLILPLKNTILSYTFS